MPNFNEILSRMKDLNNYGAQVNENKHISNATLEHYQTAANGNSYGIIKECSKYYIKVAPKTKETLAEAYEYIGGPNNKHNNEYSSYAMAYKQLGITLASLNEAYDGNVNTSTLDPYRNNIVLAENTDKMRDIIARQRQIMYNASMLMNEANEIGASRKNDTVMFDGKNPEAENGKKGYEEVKSSEKNASQDYAGSHTNGVEKKATPFENNPVKAKDQLSENCCGCEGECTCDSKNDWGSKGMGKGRDPKSIGWDIEGQQVVNEEEDWGSEGLPSTPGIGEAKPENPFVNAVNEEDDDEFASDVEEEPMDGEDFDDVEDEESFEDFDDSDIDDEDFDDAEDEESFEDFDDSDIDDEDFGDDTDDIRSQIEELQSQIDALRAQLGEEEPMDGEEEPMDDEDFDDVEEEPMDGEEEPMDGEDFDDVEEEPMDDYEPSDEDFEDEESFEEDMDECGTMEQFPMNESKRAFLSHIAKNVANSILAENELHEFGKHPGYRKKPMELPTTGADTNEWGRDWNDESVHNEQPFGEKIGKGNPFDELVDKVTKDVMYQLKKGTSPIEGEKKN